MHSKPESVGANLRKILDYEELMDDNVNSKYFELKKP